MRLAQVQNVLGRPSHKIQRDGFSTYSQPPANATPTNPAIETEDENILTDENGVSLGKD